VQSAISALFRAIARSLDVGIYRLSCGQRHCRLGVRSGQRQPQIFGYTDESSGTRPRAMMSYM